MSEPDGKVPDLLVAAVGFADEGRFDEAADTLRQLLELDFLPRVATALAALDRADEKTRASMDLRGALGIAPPDTDPNEDSFSDDISIDVDLDEFDQNDELDQNDTAPPLLDEGRPLQTSKRTGKSLDHVADMPSQLADGFAKGAPDLADGFAKGAPDLDPAPTQAPPLHSSLNEEGDLLLDGPAKGDPGAPGTLPDEDAVHFDDITANRETPPPRLGESEGSFSDDSAGGGAPDQAPRLGATRSTADADRHGRLGAPEPGDHAVDPEPPGIGRRPARGFNRRLPELRAAFSAEEFRRRDSRAPEAETETDEAELLLEAVISAVGDAPDQGAEDADDAADTLEVIQVGPAPPPAGADTASFADLGADFGADFGADHGADFGADHGADLASEPGAEPGSNLGADLGSEPGSDLGGELGAEPDGGAGAELGFDDDSGQGIPPDDEFGREGSSASRHRYHAAAPPPPLYRRASSVSRSKDAASIGDGEGVEVTPEDLEPRPSNEPDSVPTPAGAEPAGDTTEPVVRPREAFSGVNRRAFRSRRRERPEAMSATPASEPVAQGVGAEARGLLERVRVLVLRGDLASAAQLTDEILSVEPHNREALAVRNEIRQGLIMLRTAALGPLDRVPTPNLVKAMSASLSPRSMFLFTQCDGTSTLQDLIDLSGLPPLDAVETLLSLIADDLISL